MARIPFLGLDGGYEMEVKPRCFAIDFLPNRIGPKATYECYIDLGGKTVPETGTGAHFFAMT